MKPVAFVGMPGCGKSTVARKVADALGLELADTDSIIESRFGLTVVEIFKNFGEAEFRSEESEIVAAVVKSDNIAVALGGGAVLENEAVIKENCTVVYVRRGIDGLYQSLLEQAGQRPLAKTREDLERTFEVRRAIYERMADIAINNDGTVENAAAEVLKELKRCGY